MIVMNRQRRASLAQETLDILGRGYYESSSGRVIDIASDLRAAVKGTRLYRPSEFPEEITGCGQENVWPETTSEVTPETTLGAAQRLAAADAQVDILCLNFASAKNPGGGFLSGSQAQEESLARSSGLYPCLARMQEMYEFNRRLGTCLYSDHMIYSPRVPVFRDDDGRLLDGPYKVSFITAPAVNAGAVGRNEPENVALIRPAMRARVRRLLWVASLHRHSTLLLGAWGCGVFGNEPAMVAGLFAETLGPDGPFRGYFKHIVYAVYDRSPAQEVISAFRHYLTPGG